MNGTISNWMACQILHILRARKLLDWMGHHRNEWHTVKWFVGCETRQTKGSGPYFRTQSIFKTHAFACMHFPLYFQAASVVLVRWATGGGTVCPVCRLQQICRYLLLLSGTNNHLNDVIENINLVLNRLSTCEHPLCSSCYSAPVLVNGLRRRPKFEVSLEQLE